MDGPRFWNEQGFRTAEILDEVAPEAGVPMAKLAIAWPPWRRFVNSVIVGVGSMERFNRAA